MTLVSMPDPEMFFPTSSTTSTSMGEKGSRAIHSRASLRSRRSPASRSSALKAFHHRRLVVAVLDHAEPEADPGLGEHLPPHRGDDRLVAVGDIRLVVLGRPAVLAEADGHHLEEPRLDGSLEIRVGLDAIDDADPVRLGGDPVAPHGHAQRLAGLDHVHAGPERAAHGRLGDPVVREDFQLALGGGPAVAAHGGEDERLGPEVLQVVDHGADDDGDVGDAAAARSHGHRVAPLDGQATLGHRRSNSGRDVRQTVAVKGLPDLVHPGHRHSGMILVPPGGCQRP